MQTRILVPSADAPPSSGVPGLWRRKSSTGAVDAQGLGLTHPMTWIDERLFGWSHSATRGTSAWSGNDDTSRLNTPDYSDDEDTGDYEDIVGLLNDEQHQTTHKSRSRQSSYADLQRLRLGPLTAQKMNHEDLDSRLTHRTRRASLSDGVSVTRIAAVDRKEPFDAATQDLNAEIAQSKS